MFSGILPVVPVRPSPITRIFISFVRTPSLASTDSFFPSGISLAFAGWLDIRRVEACHELKLLQRTSQDPPNDVQAPRRSLIRKICCRYYRYEGVCGRVFLPQIISLVISRIESSQRWLNWWGVMWVLFSVFLFWQPVPLSSRYRAKVTCAI